MASAPSSLKDNARKAVIKATGIDQSKDVLSELNLPKSVIQYIKTEFKFSDFFVNKDDATPEEVDIGIYKAVCRLDNTAVLLKIIETNGLSKEDLESLRQWESLREGNMQRCYASFKEGDTRVHILQYMRRGDEVVKQCRKNKKPMSEKYLWRVLNSVCKQLKYCTDNKLKYDNLETHKVGFLPSGEVLIQNGLMNHNEPVSGEMENIVIEDGNPAGVYTPPEIVNGEERTEKSLTWQIGAAVYELAALRPAYQIEDADDMFGPIGEIMEGNLPPPFSYSPELNNIVNLCLNFLQECRPSLSDLIKESESKYDDKDESALDFLQFD